MASESIAHSASGLMGCWPFTGNYQVQSNPVNTDNEGTIESVCINGVSVLEGLEKEKCKEFLSAGTKQTVPNKEVSVLNGRPWSGGDCTYLPAIVQFRIKNYRWI